MAAPHFDVHPFLLSAEDVVRQLESSDAGLSDDQVKQRQTSYGPNQLEVQKPIAWYSILFKQFCNAMIIVLFIILAVSFGIGDEIEGSVVAAVIVLNVTIGFVQESQAEKKMDALRSLSAPHANVVRQGVELNIPTADVVPGDMVLLRMGDTVPADLRLLEAVHLTCDEQALTGESVPVDKVVHHHIVDPVTGQRALAAAAVTDGDRVNLAFASTTVSTGRGRGVVFATGMATSVGQIAAAAAPARPGRRTVDVLRRLLGLAGGTPLQQRLTRLSYALFAGAVVVAVVVFAVNRFRLTSETVLYATSTGVALIPESLAIVLLMTMVQAARAMRRANVVVRDLAALESLGGVTDICCDKTGTLTRGAMVATRLWLPGPVATADQLYAVEGATDPCDPTTGTVVRMGQAAAVDAAAAVLPPPLRSVLTAAALCNAATVRRDDETWTAVGAPTDVALQVLSMRFGLGAPQLAADGWRCVAEHPFDSERKRMSVVYARGAATTPQVVLAKGAVESIVAICTTVLLDDAEVPLTAALQQRIVAQTDAFAPQGLRVLALAEGVHAATEAEKSAAVEAQLSFRGLVAIQDPPRPETAPAIHACAAAGIRVRMLTGDHAATAQAIARDVGILGVLSPASAVMTAAALDALSDEQLDELPQLPLVVARCRPETKTRLVAALRRRGRFSAMTGDGANDAPSLRHADVGIAMGSGSDVAKSTAALVLADDRLGSLVAAVSEGRRMFDNVGRFLLHLLASNVAELVLLVVGLAFRDAAGQSVFPLSALHVLWLNLATSPLPALGLGRQPAAADVMQRPPHRRGVFSRHLVADILVNGIAMGAIALLTFVSVVYGAFDGRLGYDCNHAWSAACRPVFRARATVFVQLTYLILLSAWHFVDPYRSLLRLGPTLLANRLLFWSVVLGFLPPIALVYIPPVGEKVMRHAPISWEWALVFAGVAVYLLICEAYKYAKRTRGWFEVPVVDGIADDETVSRRRRSRSFKLKRIGTSLSR